MNKHVLIHLLIQELPQFNSLSHQTLSISKMHIHWIIQTISIM